MNKQLKSIEKMSLEEFKKNLSCNNIKEDKLEEHLRSLMKNDWESFVNKVEIIKDIHPDFLKRPNNKIWSEFIISSEIKTDKLLELHFVPHADSHLGSYIINRKLYYSRFWQTTKEDLEKIFDLVRQYNSAAGIVKDIEYTINEISKANNFIKNEDIEWIEQYYNTYEEDPKKHYKARLLILQGQIKFVDSLASEKKLTQTYAFEEMILPNTLILLEKAPHFIKAVKKLKSKDDIYSKYIVNLEIYQNIENKVVDIKSRDKNKFKI